MNEAEEFWKPVPKPYDEFEASNLGNLKRNGKLLKIKPGNCGYIRVPLDPKKHKQKSIAAHVLIAMAHLPNPEGKQQVDHLDNIKHHNWITNLMWCDQGTNIKNNWTFRKKYNIKPRRRKILCVETGIVYNSYKAAGDSCNRHNKRVYDALIGVQKTAGGYHWKYVEE